MLKSPVILLDSFDISLLILMTTEILRPAPHPTSHGLMLRIENLKEAGVIW